MSCYYRSALADIRLVPCDSPLPDIASDISGRLEVLLLHSDLWGTVCDHYFYSKAARVACRQLGYSGEGAQFFSRSLHSSLIGCEGSGPIVLDNLRCTGEETHLADCKHSGLGNHDCEHFEDVVVSCRLPGLITPRPHTDSMPGNDDSTMPGNDDSTMPGNDDNSSWTVGAAIMAAAGALGIAAWVARCGLIARKLKRESYPDLPVCELIRLTLVTSLSPPRCFRNLRQSVPAVVFTRGSEPENDGSQFHLLFADATG